jgi:endonuclease/exonuclease/phosphatase family metal-dependent hydrolase
MTRITTSMKAVKPENTFLPSLKRALDILYLIVVYIYGLTTAILIGMWLLLGESNYVINIFVNMMPVPLLPAPILLLIGLALRQWKSLIVLLAALATLGGVYGAAFFPEGAEVLVRGREVSILTYNIQRRNLDFAGIENMLREYDTDIVAMQEVTQEHLDYFRANLTDLYPYEIAAETITRHGQIILSKYPVERDAQSIVTGGMVDIEGTQLQIYTVQLTNPLSDDGDGFDDTSRSIQGEAVRYVASLATDASMPVVIVGDFNMSDATKEYQLFTAQLTDVFRHTRRGFGSTFPNWRFDTPSLGFLPPVIRLDYAFVNRNIEPGGARVIQQGNSDHYPLLVEIRVQ